MLEELETFLSVAECRNFTRAAQKRNLSQPTVSVQIKKLEEYFGMFLIERNVRHKTIALTPAGKILLQSAKSICAEMEYAKAAINDLQGKIEGTLRIGASQTIGEYFLPEYLGRFTKDYNKMEPEIIIANTQQILRLLADGEIDVGLVEGEITEPGIKAETFYNDKLVVITAVKENEAGEKRWIIREEGSASRAQWERFIKDNNITPGRKPIIFNTNFAVKEAVKNNLGVALISQHIAKQSAERGEVAISRQYKAAVRNFYCLTADARQERRAVSIFKSHLQHNFTENKVKEKKSED
ncbi:MAG: LysR family transcriptional regulator [Phascolarctobacterium sp.]|nr:MAG: LysR family transcriptional regulator [Phascolarctobacterium sp.]